MNCMSTPCLLTCSSLNVDMATVGLLGHESIVLIAPGMERFSMSVDLSLDRNTVYIIVFDIWLDVK